MPEKVKITVIMGGESQERAVSLVTGQAIVDNLDREKYEVKKLVLDKFSDVEQLKKRETDLFFIALHGTFGEDGRIQGMLDMKGIKYTGSGYLASAIAMDKHYSSIIFASGGLLVPKYQLIDKRKQGRAVPEKLPLVVKPVNQGSSVGVKIVDKAENLNEAISDGLKYSDQVMLQQYIEGRELTCGVLERDGEPFALSITEIKPELGQFYDYKSKYDQGGSLHICPAQLDTNIYEKVQTQALQAHKLLNCQGMSRTDFILDENDQLYVIEINTIPGMTPTSLLPEAAAADGINFSKMLDLIIKGVK